MASAASAVRQGAARALPVMSFVGHKVLYGVLTVFAVTLLVFVGLEIVPGDAASAMLGTDASAEALQALRSELGLDRGVVPRYVDWLGGLLQGDLGQSVATRTPVTDTLVPRLGNSLVLMALAASITFVLAAVLGVFIGTRAGSRTDNVLSGMSLSAAGIPDFVSGVILVAIFSFSLGLLPGTSIFPLDETPAQNFTKLILPALTLVIANIGHLSRMIRAGVAESMKSEYVEFAVLNGVPRKTVIWKYAVRNSQAPSIQVASLTLLYLLSGVIVVETLFQYPGLGQMAVQATIARDFISISSLSVVIASLYVVINIATDAAIRFVSPRARTAR